MLSIIQVNVCAKPVLLGKVDGRKVLSGLVKRRVDALTVHVGTLGIVGDIQVNKRVHGGPRKAVYAYPLDHLAAWDKEVDGVRPGESFGENLTVHGLTEHDVHIGDQFRYGDVLLRVVGPRRPCRKLALHMGENVALDMLRNGRCGWYFEVLETGELPTAGVILERTVKLGSAATVAEVFREKTRDETALPPL